MFILWYLIGSKWGEVGSWGKNKVGHLLFTCHVGLTCECPAPLLRPPWLRTPHPNIKNSYLSWLRNVDGQLPSLVAKVYCLTAESEQ